MDNYLIVNCGYTSRLLNDTENLEKICLIYIWDELWGSEGATFYNGCKQKTLDMLNGEMSERLNSGTIGFRYNDEDDFSIISCVQDIISKNHCAFFMIEDRYGEEDENKSDMITDEDIDNFEERKDKFYCGTLYQVSVVKKPCLTIRYLKFDTESG